MEQKRGEGKQGLRKGGGGKLGQGVGALKGGGGVKPSYELCVYLLSWETSNFELRLWLCGGMLEITNDHEFLWSQCGMDYELVCRS